MFSRLREHLNGSEEWNVRIAGYQQGQAEAAPVGGETIEAGEKNEKSCRITEVFTHNFCYTSALPYGILMVSGLRRMRRPRWAERRTNWMGLIF